MQVQCICIPVPSSRVKTTVAQQLLYSLFRNDRLRHFGSRQIASPLVPFVLGWVAFLHCLFGPKVAETARFHNPACNGKPSEKQQCAPERAYEHGRGLTSARVEPRTQHRKAWQHGNHQNVAIMAGNMVIIRNEMRAGPGDRASAADAANSRCGAVPLGAQTATPLTQDQLILKSIL